MSSNLDLVRSIYAAWERGDYSSAEWAHPEIEFVMADGPEPGSWEGLARMAESWRDVLGTWEELHAEAEEFLEIDSERVLVLNHSSGRGKVSGFDLAEVPWKGANLFHIHDGKVMRLVIYWDREHALADLGLAAEGDAS
jgi:ketosteroid isomerase-like protein